MFLGPSWMFLTTLMTKSRPSTSCLLMCLTAMLHSRPSVSEKSSPWITKTIRKEMDRCAQLFRFYHHNPSTGAWDIFKAQRNHVVWLQRKAKMEYFHQLLCKKSHPSHIWNSLKLTTASSALPENWSSCNSNHLSSIGFCLSLFFSSLNLTFSLSSTTVMLSGQGASSPRLPGWRPSSTMPATLSFVNVEGPPHRLLIGN